MDIANQLVNIQGIMTRNRIKTVLFLLSGLLAVPFHAGCGSKAYTEEQRVLL